MVLMREEEIIQHCIGLRVIWRDLAQPRKLCAKSKTSLPAFEPRTFPMQANLLYCYVRSVYWPETAFQNACSFGAVVAACCLADSSVAVGGVRVLQVVARLLMNPLNV